MPSNNGHVFSFVNVPLANHFVLFLTEETFTQMKGNNVAVTE